MTDKLDEIETPDFGCSDYIEGVVDTSIDAMFTIIKEKYGIENKNFGSIETTEADEIRERLIKYAISDLTAMLKD